MSHYSPEEVDAQLQDLWGMFYRLNGGQSAPVIANVIWTDVAGGTTLTPTVAQQFLACDTSTTQTTINLASAATAIGGQVQLVKLTGNMLSPVIINAGAGTTVELANAPGTFGASTWLPIQGQSAFFKYDMATARWKLWASSHGSGAPGTSAYNPAWYAAATIFVDPAAGSDANAGTTIGAPIKTWAEAVRRWGTTAPMLSVALAITFLSSHTDDTDPVVFNPTCEGNGQYSFQGGAPASVAAVFTRSSAKNRAAGANAYLAGSFSAGVPAVGKLVANTTAGKSSRAWIYKSAGGANWTMTQPLAPAAVGTSPPQAEVDTWASTDTVTVLTPVAINLVQCVPIVTQATSFVFYQFTIFDPAGPDTSTCEVGGNIQILECSSQRKIVYSKMAPSVPFQYVSNVLTLGAQLNISGGPLRLGGASNNVSGDTMSGPTQGFDGDYLCGAQTFLGGGTTTLVGLMALDATSPAITAETGSVIQETAFYGSSALYGTAAINVELQGTSRYSQSTGGTFVAAWTAPALIATGMLLNESATANSLAAAVIHSGISTTPAHFDAAAGAAGFGGNGWNFGGASVGNTL